MNENLKKLLEPTVGKIITSLVFLSWEYSYSFLGFRFYYLDLIGEYFKIGLSGVSWNNYFIRSGFMVLLWLFVAFFIFISILGYESIKIFFQNRKIKQKYLNNSEDDYKKLLQKQTIRFKTHFVGYLFFGGWFALLISGFVVFSDIFEKIRFGISDTIIINLLENNAISDSSTNLIIVFSFIMSFIFWYIFSTLLTFLFQRGREVINKEKIADEHFAVVVEDSEPDEED